MSKILLNEYNICCNYLSIVNNTYLYLITETNSLLVIKLCFRIYSPAKFGFIYLY